MKGQSIIGALVGILIAGIGMMFVISMLRISAQGTKTVTAKGEFESQVALVEMSLSRPGVCPAALQVSNNGSYATVAPSTSLTAQNRDMADIDVDRIFISPSTNLLDTLSQVVPSFTVTNITLHQVTAGNPDPANPTPYTAKLVIKGTSSHTLGSGRLQKDIPLTLTIVKPATGNAVIQSCSTSALGATGGASASALSPRQSGTVNIDISAKPIGLATVNISALGFTNTNYRVALTSHAGMITGIGGATVASINYGPMFGAHIANKTTTSFDIVVYDTNSVSWTVTIPVDYVVFD